MRRTTDGWYAWLVLAAALISNLLTMGFIFGSVGVLVAKYNEQFGINVKTSSWAGSILAGVLLCSGKTVLISTG